MDGWEIAVSDATVYAGYNIKFMIPEAIPENGDNLEYIMELHNTPLDVLMPFSCLKEPNKYTMTKLDHILTPESCKTVNIVCAYNRVTKKYYKFIPFGNIGSNIFVYWSEDFF